MKKGIYLSAAIAVGALLLLAGAGWNTAVLPEISSRMDTGDEGNITSSFPGSVMEGSIGMMSLIWDSIRGRQTLEQGEIPSPEMFDMVYRDVEITDEGLIDKETGEPILDSYDGFQSNEGKTFPSGGVGKRDYEIFYPTLNRTVEASYIGEERIQGRIAYRFSLNITNEKIDGMPSSFSGGLGTEEQNSLPFEEDLSFTITDHTSYLLDPKTSIPLNLELDIVSSFVFPDTTLLQVQEEQVQYKDETIWVQDPNVPGRMRSFDVITETLTLGTVSGEDPTVALYTVVTNYYDADTGRSLDEVEPLNETFAVNRETYRYIPGQNGGRRSGFYQFPVGNIEKIDYPMWDELLGGENYARYIGEDIRHGKNVYRYRMTTEDVEVESGNAVLPIYYHPATDYRMDQVQEWFVDAETGLMLDLTIDGTIRVTSAGPADIIDQEVGSFSVDLPDNTTRTLIDVSRLYSELLLPLSSKPVDAFSMELQFTESVQKQLVEISGRVSLILDLMEKWIPLGLVVVGVVVTAVPMVLFIRKRWPINNRHK